MGIYFQRYKSGEHQAVWQELIDLGKGVFEATVYDDAWSVSQITIERIQENLNRLHQRLNDINYNFNVPEEVVASPNPSAVEMVEEIAGPLPLSIKAFYLMIGGVDFEGTYPNLMTLPNGDYSDDCNAILSDPLLIYPLDPKQFTYYRDNPKKNDEPMTLDISADILGKARISGGQGPYIELPDKTADPPVLVTGFDNRFIDYMRVNIQWGGFPGFSWLTTPEKRTNFEKIFRYKCPPIPQDTINYLVKDLLPF